jgi:uncharacterized surface protein with fasciclin (FAS1) repeats
MSNNILDVVSGNKSLTALTIGMKAAGLEDVLTTQGPFTVFAPTDLAFGKLQEGEWPELLKSAGKEKLAGIMNNYVVKGKTNFADFKDGQHLKTIGGRDLAVKVNNGYVDVDGARIQARDMEASNGVVHSLDRVSLLN